ncbi:MAG: phytase, partial [Clostridia bacterium]|nr:phytase [Clostridia bacterium]
QSLFTNVVSADEETDAVKTDLNEDAADDPAIWVNQDNPQNSLVIGTDKKAGLYVYNLKGETTQFIEAGELNNVDLRDGFPFKHKPSAIICASNRSKNSISVFLLDKDSLKLGPIYDIKTELAEVYGLCMYKSRDNDFFIFVNGKSGIIEQHQIIYKEDKLSSKLCRKLQVNSQPEGMVADDNTGDLYIGVEEEGIFLAQADPSQPSDLKLIKESSKKYNDKISYDIEGLALYKKDSSSFLVASIQGSFSYAIFDITNKNRISYITSFIIKSGIVDGVEETDGIELTTSTLNNTYPKGMLVVQDGFNTDQGIARSQNFKFVSLEKIESFLMK